MGELFALLAGFFYGYSNTFTFRGLFKLGFKRVTIATLIVNCTMSFIVILVLFAAGAIPPPNVKGLAYFAIAGLLTTFAGRAFLFAGFGYIGPSRGSSLRAVSPVFTLFVAWIGLGERLALVDMLGIVVVLGGILLLTRESLPSRLPVGAEVSPPVSSSQAVDRLGICGGPAAAVSLRPAGPSVRSTGFQDGHSRSKVLGTLMVMGAAICFGVGDVFRKAGMLSIPSPWLGSTVGLCTGLVCLWLYCRLSRPRESLRFSDVVEKSAFMSGLLTGLALFSFFISLNYVPVAIGSVLCGTEPMFTLLTSYLVFGKAERITYRVGLGTLLVVGGVATVVLY